MHTNLSKISNVIEWTILILVIILIIHGIFNPIESETLTKDTYLINSNSSLSINDYSQQQQNLLNAVHEHLSYAVQNNISRENLRMQGGLFFITIFAGFISVLLSLKNKHSRVVLSLTLSIFGLIWYCIGVHVIDIEKRGEIAQQMLYNTELNLLKINNNKQSCYLEFRKVDSVFTKEKEGHFYRKFKSFCSPNPDQILYNLSPIAILLILHLLNELFIVKRAPRNFFDNS
jgi:hypothetical protein